MKKDSIRLQMQAKRRELFAGERHLAARAVLERIQEEGLLKPGQEVNIYCSFGSELETDGLKEELFRLGCLVSVPVTCGDNMIAARITPETRFREAQFGIMEPVDPVEVDKSRLDLIFLPGLAFSLQGDRIGYGKGYYDRFLNGTKALRVGLAYDFQLRPELPHEENDLPVDLLVTDKRIIRRNK